MHTNPAKTEEFESTYALIVRSEERPRNTFETLIYAVLIVSTMFALSQFGQHPFVVPIAGERTAIQVSGHRA
jgi:hypothetical protein